MSPDFQSAKSPHSRIMRSIWPSNANNPSPSTSFYLRTSSARLTFRALQDSILHGDENTPMRINDNPNHSSIFAFPLMVRDSPKKETQKSVAGTDRYVEPTLSLRVKCSDAERITSHLTNRSVFQKEPNDGTSREESASDTNAQHHSVSPWAVELGLRAKLKGGTRPDPSPPMTAYLKTLSECHRAGCANEKSLLMYSLTDTEFTERYWLASKIGQGNWGSCWLSYPRQQLPNGSTQFTPLALKVVQRDDTSASHARAKALWNEYKVMRACGQHRNVVQFFEFILSPSYVVVAMKYYPLMMETTLAEELYSGYDGYFHQLLGSLAWLHERGVIHGDIKPANIMLDVNANTGLNIPVLIDFGFASLHQKGDNFLTKTNWGTPEYLSPERWRSEKHDERLADVWALGVTFFEIAIGRTPFEYENEQFIQKEELEVYHHRTFKPWVGSWHLDHKLVDLLEAMLKPNSKHRIYAAEGQKHEYFRQEGYRACWGLHRESPMNDSSQRQEADNGSLTSSMSSIELCNGDKSSLEVPQTTKANVDSDNNVREDSTRRGPFNRSHRQVGPQSRTALGTPPPTKENLDFLECGGGKELPNQRKSNDIMSLVDAPIRQKAATQASEPGEPTNNSLLSLPNWEVTETISSSMSNWISSQGEASRATSNKVVQSCPKVKEDALSSDEDFGSFLHTFGGYTNALLKFESPLSTADSTVIPLSEPSTKPETVPETQPTETLPERRERSIRRTLAMKFLETTQPRVENLRSTSGKEENDVAKNSTLALNPYSRTSSREGRRNTDISNFAETYERKKEARYGPSASNSIFCRTSLTTTDTLDEKLTKRRLSSVEELEDQFGNKMAFSESAEASRVIAIGRPGIQGASSSRLFESHKEKQRSLSCGDHCSSSSRPTIDSLKRAFSPLPYKVISAVVSRKAEPISSANVTPLPAIFVTQQTSVELSRRTFEDRTVPLKAEKDSSSHQSGGFGYLDKVMAESPFSGQGGSGESIDSPNTMDYDVSFQHGVCEVVEEGAYPKEPKRDVEYGFSLTVSRRESLKRSIRTFRRTLSRRTRPSTADGAASKSGTEKMRTPKIYRQKSMPQRPQREELEEFGYRPHNKQGHSTWHCTLPCVLNEGNDEGQREEGSTSRNYEFIGADPPRHPSMQSESSTTFAESLALAWRTLKGWRVGKKFAKASLSVGWFKANGF